MPDRLANADSTNVEKRFDAFITYSHADLADARRLQNFIEDYRLPSENDRPSRKLKVFLDKTDIRSGPLSDELRVALEHSRALIVCCSKPAIESDWVEREIEFFRQKGDNRRIATVILSGADPNQVIPSLLHPLELRFVDLRRSRLLGVLLPRGRQELLRLLAQIANLDLRALIPWDKRRRLRRRALITTLLASLLAVALVFPVENWEPLDALGKAAERYQVVGCEVIDGKLQIASRFKAKSLERPRDYIAIHGQNELTVSGRAPWMDRNYNPPRRLLPARIADHKLELRALKMLADAESGTLLNESRRRSDPNLVWVGEPQPGMVVVVFGARPTFHEPDPDRPDSAERGSKVLIVGRSHASFVGGFFPEEQNLALPNSISPAKGLPVAWDGEKLWLGTPGRQSDNVQGGLWYASNDGWNKVAGLSSVASILPDPFQSNVILVSEAARDLAISSAFVQRVFASIRVVRNGKLDPKPLAGPPNSSSSSSDVELCGYLPDKTLLVRVDTTIYARGTAMLVTTLLR